jgi:uncharacterized membrane protein
MASIDLDSSNPESGTNHIISRMASNRLLVSCILAGVYILANIYLRIDLPGITRVDLRPQVVLLTAAGYFLGPVYGFLTGFVGDLLTAVLLGYGLRYLPSWNIGNGLIGLLICLYPYRKNPRLERISQMAWLVVFLILANTVSLAYAAGMEFVLDKEMTFATDIKLFYLPATLSNILGVLALFPLILLIMGRLKKNYPMRLALSNYYFITFLLIIGGIVFHPDSVSHLSGLKGISVDQGNAMVEAFSEWALLLTGLLLASLLVSSWMSKTIVIPIERLEKAVLSVLKGNPSSADELSSLTKREDEIGILSYTVKLLSERLLEAENLFRKELEKKMDFIDPADSGTDIMIAALGSYLGGLEPVDIAYISGTRDISNITAILLAIYACGLKELAATYTTDKVIKSLEDIDSNYTATDLSSGQRQFLAVALDVNIAFKGRLKVMDIKGPLSRDFAFHILERADAFLNSGKNYVGYVTDPDIIGKIAGKWETAPKIRNERLEEILSGAVRDSLISGYQIKSESDLANFDPDLKIAYSHSSLKHITQLTGLLVGEHLQAKLQLEPKRSSFVYLSEWKKTEDLNLKTLVNGTDIAHKDEFDILMEFASQKDRDNFRHLIETYAKVELAKDQKVLYESWFQPLFRSDVQLDGYVRIGEIKIRNGNHIAYVYVKEQEISEKAAWFAGNAPDMDVSTAFIWANEAFVRYLNGDCS